MFFFEIGRAIEKITHKAADYSAGRLSERINASDYPSKLSQLICHINSLVDMLRQFSRETQVSASKVSAAVTQVNSAINNSKAFAESTRQDAYLTSKHSVQLEQAAASASEQIEEVMRSAQIITEVAGGIYEQSIENKKLAEKGCSAVGELAQAMSDIQQSSADIDVRIKALTETARKIDAFLATIQGIASQTNLLALNASIEAARAGEHGRGFAVVAHEIHKLADASSAAANSANGLLVQIDTGVLQAAKAMEQGIESVQRGMGAMTQADESLKTIVSASAEVEAQLAQASAARQSQLAATNQAADVLANILDISHEVAERVKSVTCSMENQQRHLEETKEMGELLADIANQMVATTGKISLVSINNVDKNDLDRKIATLKSAMIDMARDAKLDNLDSSSHNTILAKLLEDYPDLEAAWTNRLDGQFIVSLPPAGIANASLREWFQKAAAGETYVSSIYVSAISHQPCLTIALPIKDLTDKTVAVLGVDLRITC